MAESDAFERHLRAALVRHTDGGPRDFDALAFAREVAAKEPRRLGFGAVLRWRAAGVPRLAWVLLLAVLLPAMVVGALFVGAQLQRRVPAVVPPVLPAFACPPGSTPDTPGPVDQARPSVYAGSPMAFDRRAGKLVALAGDGIGAATVIETWTFDVCTNTWTRMHPNREPPALIGRLVYDSDSDLTIGVHYEDWQLPEVTGNAWVYDLGANTWTELGTAPTAGLEFYDPLTGLVTSWAAEWTYQVETDTWTRMRPAAGQPPIGQDLPPPLGPSVYDGSVDRIISISEGDSPRQTLRFDFRTGAWSWSAAETPAFRMGMWAYPGIVYDEAAERTVVAGSFEWGAYDATRDRWETLPGIGPATMVPSPSVYDPTNRRLLIFGVEHVGDLVAFDLVSRELTVLLKTSEGQPAPSTR